MHFFTVLTVLWMCPFDSLLVFISAAVFPILLTTWFEGRISRGFKDGTRTQDFSFLFTLFHFHIVLHILHFFH